MEELIQSYIKEAFRFEKVEQISYIREIPNPYRTKPTTQYKVNTGLFTMIVSIDTLSNEKKLPSLYGMFINDTNTNVEDFLSLLDANNEKILLAKQMEEDKEKLADMLADMME